MEEQQIQQFVQRVSQDGALRKELMANPEEVIMREEFSPRVTRVLMQMVPHMKATLLSAAIEPLSYWWGF